MTPPTSQTLTHPAPAPALPARSDAVASMHAAPRPGVVENKNFAHALCEQCGWRGPGRRSRNTAEHDGELHSLTGCGV